MVIGMPNGGRSVIRGHGFDVCPGVSVKPVGLRERRHDQLRFNQREVVADALAGPCAERDVVTSAGRHALGQKTPGSNALRIGPEGGQPVQDVRDDEGEPARAAAESAKLGRRPAPAARSPTPADTGAALRRSPSAGTADWRDRGIRARRPSRTTSISSSSRR